MPMLYGRDRSREEAPSTVAGEPKKNSLMQSPAHTVFLVETRYRRTRKAQGMRGLVGEGAT